MKEPGKLTQPDFDKILAGKLGFQRKEVKTGPAFGTDVSVVDLPGNLSMALTSDPLSLIPSLGLEESAWLSVHLMANDMATTGIAPMYAQFVLNLPPSLSEDDFKTYWNFIDIYCKNIKVAITGGHTGSIEGQNSTIAGGGTMIAVAQKDKILISKNAQAGNIILLTKQCAISSAAILAMSFPQTVKARLGFESYYNACELFFKTSSLQDGLIAAGLNNDDTTVVNAMHDVTEGGVLGAVYEMAAASGNGVLIDNQKIPIGETQREICKLFSLDPRYCIGAGAMLMAVQKGHEQRVMDALAHKNIECTAIGEMLHKSEGMHILENSETKPLVYQQKDPYWNAFFNALKNNWK
jgi:hydrogenase maturation factor